MDVRSPLFKTVARLLIGALVFNPLVSVAADLAVDAAAGGNTALTQAGNGVPVINIATPNASGLSHNRFTDYNVREQGLILNNASGIQGTELGGLIHGNPNLNGAAAGLILNEITGTNPSQLQGYTEVAGQSAGVIVANPHGITCDGCGFLNTPQVTLSTGKPIVDEGQLQRFEVDQGQIALDGAGLNASNVERFDLITRSLQLNAELRANQLNVVTGRNDVDASTLAVTPRADDGSQAPQLAIDSSALGGMYAGAIRLVGTEHGVGVRLLGDMAATAGDIQIDSKGQLTIGRAAASGDITMAASDINLAQGYAGGQVALQASGQIDTTGTLASGGSQRLQAERVNNHGVLEAGIDLAGSRQASANIDLQADEVANAGLVLASGELTVTAEHVDNRSATLAAREGVHVSAERLDNHAGEVISDAALTLDVQQLDNRLGLLSGAQAVHLNSANLDNQSGEVLGSTSVQLRAGQLDNRGGQVSAVDHLDVSATRLDNSYQGTLSSQGSLTVEVAGSLDNSREGALVSAADQQLRVGELNNSLQGVVVSGGNLALIADSAIDNRQGSVVANADLQVAASGLDNREGEISAGQQLEAEVAGLLDNRAGLLAGSDQLSLQAQLLDNSLAGQILSEADLNLRARQLANVQGVVYAQGQADLQLEGKLDNSEAGRLLGDQGLHLAAAEVDNRSGVLQATSGALSLDVSGLVNNRNGMLLAGDGDTLLQADGLDNQGGLMSSLQGALQVVSRWLNNRNGSVQAHDVSLEVAERVDNDLGSVAATEGSLAISAQHLSNMHGSLFARQLLTIDAEQLNNNDSLLPLFLTTDSDYTAQQWIDYYREVLTQDWSGFVADSLAQGLGPFLGDTSVARQQELLTVLDLLEQNPDAWQQGSLLHADRIVLEVDQLSQTATSQILAQTALQGQGNNWTNHGYMASDGSVDLALSGHYDSYGTLASIDQLALQAGSLDLEAGASDIGAILGGSNASVQTAGALNNNGQLTALGSLDVRAGNIDNRGVLGAADQLQVFSQQLYNHLGVLFSGNNLLLHVDHSVNLDADIYSLGGLSVSGLDPATSAQSLANVSGNIESAGNMQLNVVSLNNRKAVFSEEQVLQEGEMTVHCYDCGGDHHNVDYIAREVYDSQIVEDSRAALLHASGDLSVSAVEVANQFSTLSASGNLSINAERLHNLGAVGGRTERIRTWNTGRTTDGTDERFRRNYLYPYNAAELPKELPLEALARYSLVSDLSTVTALNANAPAVIQAGGDLLIQASQVLENSRELGNDLPAWADDPARQEVADTLGEIMQVQVNAQLPADLQQQQVNPLTLAGFSLPDGQQGLFRLVQTPASQSPDATTPTGVSVPQAGAHPYLIETNPALTNLGQFLGSEYLLAQLGLDPGQTLKRLGDGLYEQRLVRDAVTARTDARFLAGLTSDEAMYRYLMDNALASREALNLSLGVALSAEQVAALTHDIVWLEEHEVMGESVLVPVLYLAQAEGRLAATGSLIQGQDVTLISGGQLRNQGTLRAAENLSIVAGSIDNSGLLQAHERIQLIAQQSIDNARGGIISGAEVGLTAGGDILNERTVSYYDNTAGRARQAGTILDSAARIEATGDLSMQAGGNLINQGAVIQAGGDVELGAGQDLIVSATEERSLAIRQDRRHYWESSAVTQHGSEVSAGGDLNASAGNDLAVVASQLEAGEDLTLSAQGDLGIAAAANEQHSEYRYRRSDKKVTREDSEIAQQGAQLLAGADVTLLAGDSLTAVASRIEAAQQAYLVAGSQLALVAAENLDHHFYEKKSEGSFGRKSFRSDTVTRVTQQGTEIETGGDLTLVSGSDQLHQASQLTSGAGLTLSSGGSVVFEGVLDLHQESHEKSKSSWAWQSAKGQGNTDQTLIQSQLQAQGELIIRAAEGVQIDVREINQQTVSQTIDAMVAAEPGLAWLKEMEARGDVDWRHVKEVHDSFSYSHSGLGAGAQLVIAIVVAAMVGPGASALAGGGTAGAVTSAVATSAATNAVVSTVNNRGDLGAVFDDITSSDAVKGYVVAGATAGLTAGVYDNLLGTKTNPVTGQVVVDLSTVEGVGRFAANQALQGTTSTALYRALGEDSDFSQVLGNALVNTFAAYGFNLVGDLGDRYQLPSGSAEKVLLHALMGGLAAEAYGGDFASGALVAGVNELVVADLNAQFAGLPDEQREALVLMSSQLIGVLSAALLDPDGSEDQLETGAWVAANATNYNFLNHQDVERLEQEIEGCHERGDCEQIRDRYLEVSDANRERLAACDVSGNCQLIMEEIQAGRSALDGLRGEAAAVAEAAFRPRQITDLAQANNAIVQAAQREWDAYAEQANRQQAEQLLQLAEDPAAMAAWVEAQATEDYLVALEQELSLAQDAALTGMSDAELDLYAPGWRENRDQMLVATGYVKDGAAVVGDVLEPGVLDAIGPAAKVAKLLGVFAVIHKAGEALPDGLASVVAKLDNLAAGKPPSPAELEPFRNAASAKLQEDIQRANLTLGGAKATDSASNVALFERQRAGYAAQEIRNAQPVGSALQDDPLHRAPSYVIDQIPAKGRLFTIRGGDGKSYNLTQMEGAVDGKSGIFEWLVNSKGELTHQRFIPAGRITGTPNQVPSRLPR